MMSATVKKSDGRFILLCFVAFFSLIIVVNSIFIYFALQTHSGVVIENPYEKGLEFNKTLEAAKTQPNLKNSASYHDGVLRWTLPIINASVTADMVRSVQDGYDFDIALKHIGNGVYEANPTMPLHGAWTARLKASWNNETFQTNLDFIAE